MKFHHHPNVRGSGGVMSVERANACRLCYNREVDRVKEMIDSDSLEESEKIYDYLYTGKIDVEPIYHCAFCDCKYPYINRYNYSDPSEYPPYEVVMEGMRSS